MRGLPEALGELPVSCLAEEIDTPGEGQIRALITSAGNPLVSTPNSDRLERAVEGLDFMLSIDIYLNETTRHADVILPAPGPLEKPHYDLALYQLAARNVANYSPAILPTNGVPEEWVTMARARRDRDRPGPGRRPRGARRDGDRHAGRPRAGRPALADRGPRARPRSSRSSPDGAGPSGSSTSCFAPAPTATRFGADPEGLTLARLEESPHGVDLGPLQPRIPEILRTPSGKIELAPGRDRGRRAAAAARPLGRSNGHMVLVGPAPAALQQLLDAQPASRW